MGFAYPYGIIESQLSTEALTNKLIQFHSLRVVMPSGLVIDTPNNADLPTRSIAARFDADSDPFIVYLGVALWQEGRANTIDPTSGDSDSRRLWTVRTLERPDENAGDNAQRVPVRRLNARLLLEDDDKTDLEYIPLFRVMHATRQDSDVPVEDASFVPPCLLMRGSRNLRAKVDGLVNQVESERGELARQMQRSGFAVDTIRGGEQIDQILRLRTLNLHAATLRHVVDSPGTTPAEMYLSLRQLHAELAALAPQRDPFDLPAYDHDSPSLAFAELLISIPPLLSRTKSGMTWVVDLKPEGSLLVAPLTEEQVTAPIEYFLAIRTPRDPRELRDLVQDGIRFRLASRKKLLSPLVVREVKLQEERAPQGLPAPNDVTYFRLMRTEGPSSVTAWSGIVADKTVALKWQGIPIGDLKEVKLYMIVADGRKSS